MADKKIKVKVLQKFRDKYSGEYHKVGKVMFITKERFDEINKVAGLIEEVQAKKAKNTAE